MKFTKYVIHPEYDMTNEFHADVPKFLIVMVPNELKPGTSEFKDYVTDEVQSMVSAPVVGIYRAHPV